MDAPADQHRDRQNLDRLNRIAEAIFAQHAIDFATAKRPGGWTNLTWMAGGLVLRLSTLRGSDKIRREAQLASLLPLEVGYPPIIETGVTEGHEWSLSQELSGTNLGLIWKDLRWAERMSALRQIWQKIQAVHTVDIASISSLARQHPWFNFTNAKEAEDCLIRLEQGNKLTSHQVDVLGEALDRYWQVLPAAARVLNHGDLTLENVLWHAGQVVSLMDFEFAVIAPAELDLNELVKCAFAPLGEADMLPDPGGLGLHQMQNMVAELAIPVLDHPGGKELLLGYAILLELWMLEDWLAHPEGEGPLEQWQPYRMLLSLSDGNYGYLAPLFDFL